MINKSKKRIIVTVVTFCIIVSVCIFMIPYKMTPQKRLADFEYTCDTIEASLHQLNDYEMLYNIRTRPHRIKIYAKACGYAK